MSFPPFLSPSFPTLSWKYTSSANVLNLYIISGYFLPWGNSSIQLAIKQLLRTCSGPGILQGTKKTKPGKWLSWGSRTDLKLFMIYRDGRYITFYGARDVNKAKTLENQWVPKYFSFCIIFLHFSKRSKGLLYLSWI